MDARQPVLLFDGDCGLCNRIVRLVLRADRNGSLRFASLQGDFARGVRLRHPELTGVDSMAWVEWHGEHERVLVRSEAVLRLAGYLGHPWRLLSAGRVVPRPLRDGLYDWVAGRRGNWFRDAVACQLPTAAQRERILR
ncbi:MAG TPA: DCC1-like thiol-disulfide oxidoreductase family protein [Gemmatimonadales bacterium]|nr:DCC1-like thiol-disulfide oxidoreductase family protein [Gemmatimonadales bacterium]